MAFADAVDEGCTHICPSCLMLQSKSVQAPMRAVQERVASAACVVADDTMSFGVQPRGRVCFNVFNTQTTSFLLTEVV